MDASDRHKILCYFNNGFKNMLVIHSVIRIGLVDIFIKNIVKNDQISYFTILQHYPNSLLLICYNL